MQGLFRHYLRGCINHDTFAASNLQAGVTEVSCQTLHLLIYG